MTVFYMGQMLVNRRVKNMLTKYLTNCIIKIINKDPTVNSDIVQPKTTNWILFNQTKPKQHCWHQHPGNDKHNRGNLIHLTLNSSWQVLVVVFVHPIAYTTWI